MVTQNKSKDNFIAQAGILAAAGFITRIIGFLYRSPMTAVIGELGLGYYQAAYEFYALVLLLSSYSIPSAISKVIAQRLALKEYRNAHRIFRCALGYVLVVGMAASLFLFFCAGFFVQEEAVPVLRAFAPTIFLYGILGVLRGYFQAHRSMVQTSVSQILEQIANALVSILGAYFLIGLVMGSQTVPTDEAGQVKRATFGAIGSALGTGTGVVVGLLFMVGMYALNRPLMQKRVHRDRGHESITYGETFRIITLVVCPFLLSTAMANLNGTVNNYLFTKWLPTRQGLDFTLQYWKWGIYSGQSKTVANIPVAFATAFATAMIPSIARVIATGETAQAREKVSTAIRAVMLIAIPCAAGLIALAKPIMYFLFPRPEEVLVLSSGLLRAFAVCVIFFSLSTLGNSILQGLGKVNVPIVNSGIALCIQTVVSLLLLLFTGLDCYGLAIANMVYAGTMCALNQLALRRALGYRQEWKKTFGIPLVAATVMGVGALGVYELLFLLTASMRLSLLPAIAVGVVIYFVMLFLLRAMTEEEWLALPKGHLMIRAAKKLRLLR